jgi:metal-dependent amidase/aminoacylase/carboxypeptidase family protein
MERHGDLARPTGGGDDRRRRGDAPRPAYERFGTPDVVLGQHVGTLPTGCVYHRPGPIMASTMSLDVRIHGRGGHGSRPEGAIDPIVTGAFVVTRRRPTAPGSDRTR